MSDLQKIISLIESMPVATRDEIIESLNAAAADRKKNLTRTPLRTPMQASVASPNAKHLMRQIAAQCTRIGYDLGDGSKLVDMIALDTAIRAAKDRGTPIDSWALKTSMAQLGLIR